MKKRAKLSLDSTLVLFGLVSITWIFWPNHFESFVFSKFTLLVVFGAWIVGLLVVNFDEKKIRSIYSILVALFLLWFAYLAISDDVVHTSLFGVQGRNMGFLSYASLFVISLFFYFTASPVLLDKSVLAFSIACFGVTGYGIMQILKLDPFEWQLVYQGIIGNLGNPNFMSVMGAFSGAASLYLSKTATTKLWLRLMGFSGFFSSLAVIYFSKSTQGWIVLLIAVTPLAYLEVSRFGKFVTRSFIPIVGAVSVFGGLAIFNIGPLSRILYQESLSYRSDFWEIAWRMAKDNPLFGVGIDRYQNFYREYKTLDQVRSVGAEDFSDSAHNLYLHFAATGGFLLAGLLLLLNIFIAYRFIVALKRSSSAQHQIALIFGVWLGIQAQSLISIDYPSIALWGWVFAGLGVGLSYKNEEKPTLNEMHLGRKYFGMFVSISMTAMTLFVVTPIASAQSQLRTGFYAYVAKGDAEAVRIKANFFKQMESKDPRNPTLPILSANSLFQDEAYEEAIEASRRAIIIDDHDYRSWWFLATSLEKLGRREEALEARKRTIELSPFNITNLLELGKNQVSVGDLSSARNTLAQMAEIAPGSAEVQELTNLTQQTP